MKPNYDYEYAYEIGYRPDPDKTLDPADFPPVDDDYEGWLESQGDGSKARELAEEEAIQLRLMLAPESGLPF